MFLWHSAAFPFNVKDLSPGSRLEVAHSQPGSSQTNPSQVEGISTWPGPSPCPACTCQEPMERNLGGTLLENLLGSHFNSGEVSWV